MSVSPAAMAAGLLASYRVRDNIFGGDFFGAPPWEVLLVLQVSLNGLPIEAICAMLGIKRSITVRWLNILVSRDLVSESHQDGAVVYSLTRKAQNGLAMVLRASYVALDEPPPSGG